MEKTSKGKNIVIGIVKVILVVLLALLLFMVVLFSITGLPHHHFEVNNRAETTAHNLKNSISAYFTEYRRYPFENKDSDTTLDSSHALMDILLGSDKEKEPDKMNPRGIAFFTDRAAKPMGNDRFRSGVTLDADGSGELWDPWGNYYRVRFDSNYDNQVENPEVPGTSLPECILIWSAGEDGKFETWKDNVRTWETPVDFPAFPSFSLPL